MHLRTRAHYDFPATRLGVIMRPEPNLQQEGWGVLNPGGVRASDGTLHLFPRIIAEGNYSRIAHARVIDLERPMKIFYRSPSPVLAPQADCERGGLVSNAIFPTVADRRADHCVDIYYAAADRVVAAARIGLPNELLT